MSAEDSIPKFNPPEVLKHTPSGPGNPYPNPSRPPSPMESIRSNSNSSRVRKVRSYNMEDSVVNSFKNAMKNAAKEEWPPISLNKPKFVCLENNEIEEAVQTSQETQDRTPVNQEDDAQDMESDDGSDDELDEDIRRDIFGEEKDEDVSKGVDLEKHAPNTPPVNTRMLLDDLDKTPRSPAVKIVHQKEVDAIKGKNRNEDELFQVPWKTKPEDFVEQINKSKEYTNAIVVQGEDRMTSPIDFKGDVVIENQKDDFVHSVWGKYTRFTDRVIQAWRVTRRCGWNLFTGFWIRF
jgi:hypothetical protein